ncbi:HupE/UreJ family protein [Streptomyces sp. BH-SS-21]|uniref:HupE/UreJ family protein n=1 Tax=Streptomyces liliiviolaceus TaxID=2823109 RepID=A0A941BBW3_9ACTN|nr:HupE/UreJ family protein [Streptomyces liliiviolaceus]MBQ0852583.1 HupE/UreJ family protein [Streptomyces liliiviolaceus]
MSHPVRRPLAVLAVAVFLVLLGLAGPASAHGFTSTVYVHVTESGGGGSAGAGAGTGADRLRTELKLEYDLLVVSAADAGHDDPLFRAGTEAFEAGDTEAQAAALNAHHATVVDYVTGRLAVTAAGDACRPAQAGGFRMGREEGVPYALLTLDWTCAAAGDSHVTVDHEIRSGLFPDAEEYVKGTKTIATYDVAGRSGSAALDAAHPSFSLGQSWTERFWEFFRLGAEHLLTGIDHILFLLALIAGSRRPREIVLAATSFTLAHSVTFLLAALGLVDVPGSVVEPVIALSIAVVAGWHLWRIRQRGVHVTDLAVDPDGGRGGHFALDRAGWTRLGVVFCFGLVHGLGFAGALGIDAAWSWTLLWSLLVFNVGIEAVQLAIIAVVFPLLLLLRRRSRRAGLWATGTISAGVAAMGLIWFVQRTFGL